MELYRVAGCEDFAFWTELAPARRSVGEADIAGVRTIADALKLERYGIRAGRYALSPMMRNCDAAASTSPNPQTAGYC